MDFKKFLLNPITITVGIILTLGILAIVGYNYWGWFGGTNSDGFPSNPKDGESFTKGNQTYVFRAINCATTPCEGGSWVLQHSPLPYERDSSNKKVQNVVNNSDGNNDASSSRSASKSICTDTKTTFEKDGTKVIRHLVGVTKQEQPIGTQYWKVFRAQGFVDMWYAINKSEYDDLISKCNFPTHLAPCITIDLKEGTVINGVCYANGGAKPTQGERIQKK